MISTLVPGTHAGGLQNDRRISGTIKDESGMVLPGVNVIEKGTNNGTATDADGRYSLAVTNESSVLVFTFIGYTRQEVVVNNQSKIDITLLADIGTLDEVVVTAYGVAQKKESLVSAITTVEPRTLRGPTGNMTNMLAGRVAGVIAYQQSGEPGNGTDNSKFYIRGLSTFGTGKVDPLILIDNMESTATDMARLQTDDVATFSVLKDAQASALYGARGANGVILITTKMGEAGVPQFNFRVENRFSTNTQNYKMTDNISYMRDANEATLTRNPESALPYSENKIIHTMAGDDPNLYPSNNWLKTMIKDYTINQSYNMSISGGGEKARYYIAGTYNRDNGILRSDALNKHNSNIKLTNYSFRSNISLDITKTTELVLRVYGQFDDYNGPIGGGAIAFQNALSANPVMFPAVYPKSKLPYVQHPLFGSTITQGSNSLQPGLYTNPYAEMVSGHQTYKGSNIEPQLQLTQKLDFITKGLTVSSMAYLQRYSYLSVSRRYMPFYYSANIDPNNPTNYTLSQLNSGQANTLSIGTPGTEFLNFEKQPVVINQKIYLQGTVNYDRTFEKHAVTGLLTSYISSYQALAENNDNPNDPNDGVNLNNSLPQRNSVTAGRFTYMYDNRYVVELTSSFMGSERFAKNHRFGFFPTAGLAYIISNEAFFQSYKNVVSSLKFRATYGVAGNDQIGRVEDRFFYLSQVNPNDGNFGASFGTNNGTAPYYNSGYSVSRYSNPNVTWELSKQINFGMDINLFDDSFSLIANVFKTYRSDILLPKSNVEAAQGLTAIPSSNYGKGETSGVDLTVSYDKDFTHDFSATLSGTFTYATSKVTKFDEIKYDPSIAYLSKVGRSFNQEWGLVAERLFIDDNDVMNSPRQQFAVAGADNIVRGGDIKYRDINRDGVINNDDRVPIGYPTQPEIVYGIGASMTYKDFDFGFMFQGVARSTFFIDQRRIQPFNQYSSRGYDEFGWPRAGTGYQNGELQAIHESHWSEENPDAYAFYPRLSPNLVANNLQQSTWWMRDGSFIRLKQVTMGYTFSPIGKQVPIKPRLYFSASNLFIISSFKMWDTEMGGNGLGYPVQSAYMLGLQVKL